MQLIIINNNVNNNENIIQYNKSVLICENTFKHAYYLKII